jgi:hypothetical protein
MEDELGFDELGLDKYDRLVLEEVKKAFEGYLLYQKDKAREKKQKQETCEKEGKPKPQTCEQLYEMLYRLWNSKKQIATWEGRECFGFVFDGVMYYSVLERQIWRTPQPLRII